MDREFTTFEVKKKNIWIQFRWTSVLSELKYSTRVTRIISHLNSVARERKTSRYENGMWTEGWQITRKIYWNYEVNLDDDKWRTLLKAIFKLRRLRVQ